MAEPASLQNLHDVIEPTAVGFWPPAHGVWILVGLAMLWAVVGVVIACLHHRQNAYRRSGMRELGKIREGMTALGNEQTALPELAGLLKRVALTAFPRAQVASLNGEKWLSFLDQTMGGNRFSISGTLLTESIYKQDDRSQEISRRQIDELFDLAGKWIQQHKPAMSRKGDTILYPK